MSDDQSKKWEFWVDRGGTFTDIVARDPVGRLISHKLLSENPGRYSDAAVQGIRDLMDIAENAPLPIGQIAAIKMGTTVATNALLERKGEPTAFLITKGFRDLLRIGYQNRPDIFALNIQRPELLYGDVVEVDERLSSEGAVIRPLAEDSLIAAMQHIRQKGYYAIAVALLHSFRNPEHEIRIGALASQMGFTQISLSHETSPLIKLVARGETTVADAYLSPVLRHYVNQLRGELGQSSVKRLMFMRSDGGLTDADLFQGRDAVLSGPAGGVVGMVRAAAADGFGKLIGFDMGGTSTDVSHYQGEFERSFENEVAGIRLRAPMMNIHTVAAGGGSILMFRDGRMQVGPESAGAYPGPACYRNGGPLTVTDCNVVLGKLQAEAFPNVFGSNGDEPLDTVRPRQLFEELAVKIATETGESARSVEQLAEGYLQIAVENMANAIKKISVARGYDLTDYTLNCFGGAGGQHACMVADALGMSTIYLHPFSGVLSALGMGLANITAMRERQMLVPIERHDAVLSAAQELGGEAQAEVAAQGFAAESIALRPIAHIRAGQAQSTFEVPISTLSEMRESFVMQHKAMFGFEPDTDELIVDMITVEAIGDTGISPVLPDVFGDDAQSVTVQMWSDGGYKSVPCYDRSRVALGMTLQGPAIVQEATGTTIIEAGWQAECRSGGALVLTRVASMEQSRRASTERDPVYLELFNNLFRSIAEQMGEALAKTALSVNIRERLDFSCALFDHNGDLVANAPHVPVHLGSMSMAVKSILKANAASMRRGDVFMMNDPFSGGTHLPDVTVITPVFDAQGEQVEFVVASRGHHADIGGKTPGSAPPDSRHIDEEGVLLRNHLLVRDGILQEETARRVLASGPYPCRNINQNLADLKAQIAANAAGVAELNKAVQQFGSATVSAYMQYVQDNAEENVRRLIDGLEDCAFAYPLDSGAVIKVAIRVDPERREAEIDFTGTSPQDAGNYNAPFAVCRAVVLYVLRTLIAADIPMNEGFLRPIHIIAPEGSMLRPIYPAAVIAGNTEVSQAIADTLFGALGVVAGSQGTMNNFIYGDDHMQNYETICGGAGAGDGFDGCSAVHTHMTNTRMTDPEILESRFPLRVQRFAIREGSGGQGAWRGGDGLQRELEFLAPMTATVLSSHRVIPPHGMKGGEPGSVGVNQVRRADGAVEQLNGNDARDMQPGDVFIMQTPGGGGYGPITT